MTTNELKQHIGQTVLWTPSAAPHCRWQAKVKDARIIFGRTELLITPVTGEGEQWVSSESCKQSETK